MPSRRGEPSRRRSMIAKMLLKASPTLTAAASRVRPLFLSCLANIIVLAMLSSTPGNSQTLWSEQYYTRSYPRNTHRQDQAISSSTTYSLPQYREIAERTALTRSGKGELAAVWAKARSHARPTLFEVLGSGLDGRTIDGLPINGRSLRNKTDLSESSFESAPTSPSMSNSGRLNGTRPWIPKYQNPYEFVQLSFPTTTLISHISTAGGGAYHNGWVTSFKLSHSFDGATWQWYTEPGSALPHIFAANTDRSTVVRHRLHGDFTITSIYADGTEGRAKLGTSAPLLTRFLRIFPVSWNSSKIALRFDFLRRIECGDGFWDEMHEGCDDGNVVSGDGCSGTTGEWQGTEMPCMKETFTTRTSYNVNYPQRYLNGEDSGHTIAKPGIPPHPKARTQWCHRGSDCYDCMSLRVNPNPKRFLDPSTQQYFDDPLHMQECAGRRSRRVGPDGTTDIRDRPTYPDDGYIYRTTDARALGTRHLPSSTLPRKINQIPEPRP